jgi:transcriptional regulator
MYQPPHFIEPRLEVKHELIRAHPLGLLISLADGAPIANPLPFLLDAHAAPLGLLRAHLARGNAHWRALQSSPSVLVVFQGVNTYVTPSWYQTKRETGKVVPTWNYAMVQVRGTMRVIEDRDWLFAQVTALTNVHEGPREQRWAVTDAPAGFIDSQLKGIVGLEMEIAAIDGKWKVSQNRSAEDVRGVIAGLAETDDPSAQEMARLMRERTSEV